jgi:hypothetical protein
LFKNPDFGAFLYDGKGVLIPQPSSRPPKALGEIRQLKKKKSTGKKIPLPPVAEAPDDKVVLVKERAGRAVAVNLFH